MLEIQAVKKAQSENAKFKSGVAAHYIRINRYWGLKFFRDEHDRDYTYDLQKTAHKNNIGPGLGLKVSFIKNNKRYYGYTTEHVLIYLHVLQKKNIPYRRWTYPVGYDNLCHKMNELNMDADDMHYKNFGYTMKKHGKRKLVCIDFHLS